MIKNYLHYVFFFYMRERSAKYHSLPYFIEHHFILLSVYVLFFFMYVWYEEQKPMHGGVNCHVRGYEHVHTGRTWLCALVCTWCVRVCVW